MLVTKKLETTEIDNHVQATDFERPDEESHKFNGKSPKDDIIKLRVSSTSNCKDLAGSIAKFQQQGKKVVISAIGSQAINQAVKSIPIANSYLAPQGTVLVCLPYFEDKQIEIEGGQRVERTSINFQLISMLTYLL